MIASQKIGKSFIGALSYNLKKLYHTDPKQRAELLATNFASMSAVMIKREIDLVRTLRPNLSRYVYHTSLNFSKEELQSLNNDKLKDIAQDYLNANGFSNNQYFIFRHHDADHPHLHLLVNRIRFDGSVVSDSNNYKKSEAILRGLEYQYNLRVVEQSFVVVDRNNKVPTKQSNSLTTERDIFVAKKQQSNVPSKAPTKNEIEMMLRTGKSSNKLLLQEIMKTLIARQPKSIADLIVLGEKAGIHFLFNQVSTGSVFGITYFFKDFKAKGQALGNQFKWAELIKKIHYNQLSDTTLISEANSRTVAKYGLLSNIDNDGNIANNIVTSSGTDHTTEMQKQNSEPSPETANDSALIQDDFKGLDHPYQIEISDDIDDEAILGRNRHRQKKARTNRR